MAAGIAPAYEYMSIQYDKTVTEISYLTSIQILVLGVFPLFFVPLMNIYGRRPFLIFSSLACCALNIGGGFCTSYSQQMATWLLVAITASTGSAAGSSIVADLAFSHDRGKKNGWCSVGYVLGTPGDLSSWALYNNSWYRMGLLCICNSKPCRICLLFIFKGNCLQ